jgi:predicted TIM-barrel fold metal-dependent hydrolase
MHILDPIRYPYDPSATYNTSVHSLWSAIDFETRTGMSHIVLVQPSLYAQNNTFLLLQLRALGPERARAVVQFAPDTAPALLAEWHSLGVRGVRLNLLDTAKQMNNTELAQLVRSYADIVRPLNWTLQIYINMERIRDIESTLLALNVTLCFDHFGHPKLPALQPGEDARFDAYSVPGFGSLIKLIEQGKTWVKFSAAYRVDPKMVALNSVAREILKVRTDRMVFATDWPHTRFEDYDVRPFVERCLAWAQEFNCVEQMFSGNARTLWDV